MIIAGLALTGGAFFVLVGCIGLVRMPDRYTRMHAASITDTLGAGLVLLGLLLLSSDVFVAAKLVTLGLLIFFASPTATHALALAARMHESAAPERDLGERPSTH